MLVSAAYEQSILTVCVTLLCSLKSVLSLQFLPTASHDRYRIYYWITCGCQEYVTSPYYFLHHILTSLNGGGAPACMRSLKYKFVLVTCLGKVSQNAQESISERLELKNLLGGLPPDPPSRCACTAPSILYRLVPPHSIILDSPLISAQKK